MNSLNDGKIASSVFMNEEAEQLAARDRSIVDAVYRALRASGYCQLLRLQVYCDHGRVTLQGRLPTFYLKQVAQSALRSIHGIRDIDNDITVLSSK
jgi:osmotically-inducible protein OsmY